MLGKITKSKSISATIHVPEEGSNPPVIAYVTGSLMEDGNCTITKNIQSKALCQQYQQEVANDYAEFERIVMEETI